MISIRRCLVCAAVVVAGLAAADEGVAGPGGDQLRARLDRVVGIVEDRARRHWQAATPAERDELVRLFAALLERAYVGRVERFDGERFAIAGESIDGEWATVRTRLVSRGGGEIAVEYRLHPVGDRWLAYDVSVEGVSLVASYRSQFDTIIRTSSTQGLVQRLRAREE